MQGELRIVCGGRWTIDGRWVVVGPLVPGGPEVILFDPSNGMNGPDDFSMAMVDLIDCILHVKELEGR